MLKRPIILVSIGSILGILMGIYTQGIFPFLFIIILFTIIIIILFFYNYRYWIILLIFCLIFGCYTQFLENNYENKYKNYIDNTIRVIGTVVTEKEEKEYRDEYEIIVKSVNRNSKFKEDHLLINIKKDLQLEYGDIIEFTTNYVEANSSRNYKGFDYKNYLKTKGIYTSLKCDSKDVKILGKNDVNLMESIIFKINKEVENRLNKLLPENTRGLLLGILMGNTKNITEDLEENFRDSNLSHTLAISGSHVTYIIIGISRAIGKIKNWK